MTLSTRQTYTIQNAQISSIRVNGHVCPESGLNLAVFTGNMEDTKAFRRVPIIQT